MAEPSDLALLLLSAGKGTRMRSERPKVLHPVCGRSIIEHQIRFGRELGASRIVVVVGTGAAAVRDELEGSGVEFVVQDQTLGTGHAVQQAKQLLGDHPGTVLTLYGDHPLYRAETLGRLVDLHVEGGADLALLVGEFPEPVAYGRIVRGESGAIRKIVERTDATPDELAIREVNVGVYATSASLLFEWVDQLSAENEQREYYLTDIVDIALKQGRRVETGTVEDWTEALGINDRADLARAEAVMRGRLAQRWMREGVTFVDPERTYLDVDVEIGPDTVIEAGCTLRGATRVGAGSRIAAGSVIDDSVLGSGVHVKPHCWLEGATAGDRCVIGPSAHLRPDTVLEDDVRIGNFVEVKNSRLGHGTKADHLSYVGDADVGAGVTIGCGAITVNYDGERKNRTRIGDGAFVGCNANLIAPVEVREGAYVAAGSTITTDVPEGALSVARARQRDIEGWRERRFGRRDEED